MGELILLLLLLLILLFSILHLLHQAQYLVVYDDLVQGDSVDAVAVGALYLPITVHRLDAFLAETVATIEDHGLAGLFIEFLEADGALELLNYIAGLLVRGSCVVAHGDASGIGSGGRGFPPTLNGLHNCFACTEQGLLVFGTHVFKEKLLGDALRDDVLGYWRGFVETNVDVLDHLQQGRVLVVDVPLLEERRRHLVVLGMQDLVVYVLDDPDFGGHQREHVWANYAEVQWIGTD